MYRYSFFFSPAKNSRKHFISRIIIWPKQAFHLLSLINHSALLMLRRSSSSRKIAYHAYQEKLQKVKLRKKSQNLSPISTPHQPSIKGWSHFVKQNCLLCWRQSSVRTDLSRIDSYVLNGLYDTTNSRAFRSLLASCGHIISAIMLFFCQSYDSYILYILYIYKFICTYMNI